MDLQVRQGNEEEEEQILLLNSFPLPPTCAMKQELTQNWEHPEPILYSCVQFSNSRTVICML